MGTIVVNLILKKPRMYEVKATPFSRILGVVSEHDIIRSSTLHPTMSLDYLNSLEPDSYHNFDFVYKGRRQRWLIKLVKEKED